MMKEKMEAEKSCQIRLKQKFPWILSKMGFEIGLDESQQVQAHHRALKKSELNNQVA